MGLRAKQNRVGFWIKLRCGLVTNDLNFHPQLPSLLLTGRKETDCSFVAVALERDASPRETVLQSRTNLIKAVNS